LPIQRVDILFNDNETIKESSYSNSGIALEEFDDDYFDLNDPSETRHEIVILS